MTEKDRGRDKDRRTETEIDSERSTECEGTREKEIESEKKTIIRGTPVGKWPRTAPPSLS